MTTSACNTFFTVPELIELLTHFLPKEDVVHLSQTNQHINSICTPACWRRLDFLRSNSLNRLLDSPESLKALYSNINSVRSIEWSEKASWWYINALWVYLNTPSTTTTVSQAHHHLSLPTDALSHPNWGQLSTTITATNNPLQPMPPMVRLTHYNATFGFDQPDHSFRPEYSTETHRSHHHHLFWLLRLNRETLTSLVLFAVPFASGRLFRDACRTLSQLNHLKILQLFTLDGRCSKSALPLVKLLFLSCPGSLTELTISGIEQSTKDEVLVNPIESDWDFCHGPLVPRQEPLHHLTTLELPRADVIGGYSAPFLGSILRHCPAVKNLTLPSVRQATVAQAISEVLGEHTRTSPLTDLTIPREESPNNEAFMTLMKLFQEQSLRNLCVFSFRDVSSRMLSTAAFSRHSETLCQIELVDCRQVKSATLQAILVSCRALASLKVKKSRYIVRTVDVVLSLEDAVETAWVCTKIQDLTLSVSITFDGRDPAYLSDPTMKTWTEQDHEHWKMLDKFYSQIGSLKELQFLHLIAAGSNPDNGQGVTDVPYKDTCFPGLLALEDPATGQIGFLSRWSGLTRLQKLTGSFLVTTRETAARMGEHEVDWFVNQLPALTRASLLEFPCDEAFPGKGNEFDPSVVERYPEVIREILLGRPDLELVEFVR